MQRSHEPHGGFTNFGRPISDKCSDAVAHLHHADGGEIADAGAQAGSADLELVRKLPLRWDLIAGLERTTFEHGTDVVDHLHGQMSLRAARRSITHWVFEVHKLEGVVCPAERDYHCGRMFSNFVMLPSIDERGRVYACGQTSA